MPLEETWVGDTWVTGPRIGEIESLAVLPQQRGQGLGSRAPRSPSSRELRAEGVTDLVLGLLPGNDAAARLYARRGYRRNWLYLSRFDS